MKLGIPNLHKADVLFEVIEISATVAMTLTSFGSLSEQRPSEAQVDLTSEWSCRKLPLVSKQAGKVCLHV